MREGPAEFPEQPAQDPEGARRRGGIARPQERRDQVLGPLPIEGERPYEGEVAPGVVVAAEESELLLAVGRVDVDGDAGDPTGG